MTTPKTPLDLDAIRARVEAATPGPWVRDTYRQVLAGLATMTGNHAADAAFVRLAREDVAALLAEVERLRVEVKNLHDEMREQARDARDEIAWQRQRSQF